MRRLAVAVLLCAATSVQGRADERADQVVTAFRSICLARPDSLWAIDALAVAQGFGRGFDPATAVKASLGDPGDLYNLVVFWRRGEGRDKITLNGLVLGNNPLSYTLLCQIEGDGLLPDDVISALKPLVSGKPETQKSKDSSRIRLAWKIPADPRRDVLEIDYDPGKGRQRIGLSFEQTVETPAK